MITPSHSYEAIFCVSRVAPMHRLNARDLRFDPRAQAIAVFHVEPINAFVLDVFNDLVMPAGIFATMHDGMSRRWDDRRHART
jgi:hypothetical protein